MPVPVSSSQRLSAVVGSLFAVSVHILQVCVSLHGELRACWLAGFVLLASRLLGSGLNARSLSVLLLSCRFCQSSHTQMETKLVLSDPSREPKQPKQQAPATDRKPHSRSKTAAAERSARNDTSAGSADGQKRYSEKLLSVHRKLFSLADAWNVELVLLVGGRTVEPVLSSFRPGPVTQWMLANQAAASISKSVADKPLKRVRSDEFTQGAQNGGMTVPRYSTPQYASWHGRLSRRHACCWN